MSGTELITGMEEIVQHIKDLEIKNKQLQEENKKLEEENEDNLASLNFYTEQCAELKDERKKLKEEIFELEMKGNARKDIIKNMFECITADIEEVQDGFYIKRDWGNKCIDKWNKIVTQEYKDALKEINEQLEGIEWETDGYQFDLNIVEEEDEEENILNKIIVNDEGNYEVVEQ